jgi:hypothetical protein
MPALFLDVRVRRASQFESGRETGASRKKPGEGLRMPCKLLLLSRSFII